MKRLTRLILCLAMLLCSAGMQAQTAADAMFNQGIALKKQGTKEALTAAITKLKNAEGLFAAQAAKVKCTVR